MADREPALPGVPGQLPPVGARPVPGVDGFAVAASGIDKDFKGDEVEENGADVDEYPKTHSDDDENDAELAAFREILLESFADVDTDNSNMIPVESLGTIMDQLAEEDVLTHYEPEDLEMLASDMDAEGTGFIPLEEFIDVMFRREMGYIVKAKNEHEVSYHPIGKAPVDFTEKELEEAFKVFALGQSEFGAKEIRGVMAAVAELEVTAFDASKMIQAAATTSGKETITFEEFKEIINWSPPDEKKAQML